MKPLQLRIASAILLLILGTLLGWVIAPKERAPSSQANGLTTSTPTKSTRSTKSSSRDRPASSSQHALLRSIRDSPDEHSRLLASLNLAHTLPLSEASKWLDEGLFSQREGFALTLFTKTLKERWQKEDPDGFVLWQIGNGETPNEERMAELANSNPELLLARIALIQDSDTKIKALASLANSRPDLALAEIAKLPPGSNRSQYKFSEIFQNLARKDRASLEAALEDLPFAFRSQAKSAIYGEKLRENFKATLTELEKDPNGCDILMNSREALSENPGELLASFSNLPPAWQERIASSSSLLTSGMDRELQLTTEWESFGLSSKQAAQIRGYALYGIVREEKATAIAKFQEANLSPDGTRRLIDLLRWNSGNEIIDELLPLLDQESQDYVAKNRANNSSNAQTYANASELSLAISQATENQDSLLRNQLSSWNWAERKKFNEDYQAIPEEERQTLSTLIATSRSSSYLGLQTKTLAVEDLLADTSTLELLTDNQKKTVARNASEIALSQFDTNPATATAWVKGLPEGENRQWAMKNLATYWANFEPHAARDWVNNLPATDRTAVLEHLGN